MLCNQTVTHPYNRTEPAPPTAYECDRTADRRQTSLTKSSRKTHEDLTIPQTAKTLYFAGPKIYAG